MSVYGISKSVISRIKNVFWNTVDRWLYLAFLFAQQFNTHVLHGYEIIELQADEIRTFVGSKKKVRWVFTALEVSFRLWVRLAVGLLDVLLRGCFYGRFLFTTDGFEMDEWLVNSIWLGHV